MQHEHGQREALTIPGHLERMPPVTRGCQRYLDDCPEGDPPSLFDLQVLSGDVKGTAE